MKNDTPQRQPVFDGILMGTGTWQWGDRLNWGYGGNYAVPEIQQAYEASLAAGIHFFDTAESYGQGKSETNLGRLIIEAGQPVTVATKFMPYPWRLNRRNLLTALQHSLERLQLPMVDLYQVHWPFPPMPIEMWMEAMAQGVQAGLIKSIGVSNFNQNQTRRAVDTLARFGLPLASNQMEYHLLNRQVEKNGLLSMCREQGIALIAYSPLAQGMLTGKYTTDNPPKGVRAAKYGRQYLKQIQPLITLMRKIGSAHDGKTPAQVALNWTICKGTIPIPGAKSLAQLQQNAGALGWRLDEAEITDLDQMSERVI